MAISDWIKIDKNIIRKEGSLEISCEKNYSKHNSRQGVIQARTLGVRPIKEDIVVVLEPLGEVLESIYDVSFSRFIAHSGGTMEFYFLTNFSTFNISYSHEDDVLLIKSVELEGFANPSMNSTLDSCTLIEDDSNYYTIQPNNIESYSPYVVLVTVKVMPNLNTRDRVIKLSFCVGTQKTDCLEYTIYQDGVPSFIKFTDTYNRDIDTLDFSSVRSTLIVKIDTNETFTLS